MQIRSIPTLALICITSFMMLLQGCGVPGPGGGRTSSPDDSPFVPVTTIPLRIEATKRIAGQSAQLPDEGQHDIETVSPSSISLVSLDFDFGEGGPSTIPQHRIVRGEFGGYEIQFNTDFIGQLDIVAKVRFDTQTVLYGLVDLRANRDPNYVIVNLFSHYILSKLYDQLSTEEDLQELLPENSEQAYLKVDLYNNAMDTFSLYDIDISGNDTRDELLNSFDQNIDLKTHVENAVKEITQSTNPFHQGTPRNYSTLNEDQQACVNIAKESHSAWFGIMLNDILPDDNQNEVMFGRAISTNVDANVFPEDNAEPLYPILQQTTEITSIRNERSTAKNYFARDTLTISAGFAQTLDKSEPIRRWESGSSDNFLSTSGYILYDKTLTTDTPTNTDNIGRRWNPIYSRLYKANDYECDTQVENYGHAPTWYTSSNLGTGANYELQLENGELVIDEDNNFVRQEQLELKNMFTWEIYGLESDGTDESQMNGKEYGALSLSLDFAGDGEIVTAYADTLHWIKPGGDLIENQPNNHYRSYRIARNEDGSRVPLTEDLNLINNVVRPLYPIDAQQGFSDPNNGLIGLDGGLSPSLGHLTANGMHMAFNMNDQFKGQGILIATELRDPVDIPLFTSEDDSHYQLTGNILSISDTHNSLFNINGSTLDISDSVTEQCIATLTLNRRGVEHEITNNALSDQKIIVSDAISSSFCRLGSIDNGGEIEISFDDVDGAPLTLRGFVAKTGDSTSRQPGTFIPLLWIQEGTLGLAFANLEQNLTEGFEE